MRAVVLVAWLVISALAGLAIAPGLTVQSRLVLSVCVAALLAQLWLCRQIRRDHAQQLAVARTRARLMQGVQPHRGGERR